MPWHVQPWAGRATPVIPLEYAATTIAATGAPIETIRSLFIGPFSPGEPHQAAPPVVDAIAVDEVGGLAAVSPRDSSAIVGAARGLARAGADGRRAAAREPRHT